MNLEKIIEIARCAIHHKFCQVVAACLKDKDVPGKIGRPFPIEQARELHQFCSQRFGLTGKFKPNHQEIDALLQPFDRALKQRDKLALLTTASSIASAFQVRLAEALPQKPRRVSKQAYEWIYLGAAVRQFQLEGLILSKVLTAYTLECRRRRQRKRTDEPQKTFLRPSLAQVPSEVNELIEFGHREFGECLWMLAAEFLDDDGDMSDQLESARNLHLWLSNSGLLHRFTGPEHQAMAKLIAPLEAAIRAGDKLGFLAEFRGMAALFQASPPVERPNPHQGSKEDAEREQAIKNFALVTWFQMKGLLFAKLLAACALWSKKQRRKQQ